MKKKLSRLENKINYALIIPLLVFPDLLFKLIISGRGRMTFVSLIFLMVYAYFLQFKKFRRISFSGPMLVWLTLTTYHLVNATMKHVPDINFPKYLLGYRIYASICIYAFLYSCNGKKTAKVLYWSLGIWLLIAFLATGYTPGERLTGEDVIAVAFGKNAAMMAIVGTYLTMMEGGSLILLGIRMIWPIIIILLAQGRNAFGMALIQLAGYYYSIVLKAKVALKQGVFMAIAAVLFFIAISYTMEYTSLGDRFQTDIDNVETATWREQYLTGTVFDYIAGERITYYVLGWAFFMESPITGIGLDNYIWLTMGDYPMHIEYMVHLAEGGIIAAILWLTFIFLLFRIIIKSDLTRQMKWMALFTMFSILFTCAFSVMYENDVVISLFGLILSINYPSRNDVFHRDKYKPILIKKKKKHGTFEVV